MQTESKLSTDFIVATEIYAITKSGESVWYTKLVERLNGIVEKADISKALNVLYDWRIMKIDYGETTPGHAGSLLSITEHSEPVIKALYEKYRLVGEDVNHG